MKKGKLKKFLTMFSSFAIGCSTLFMLTGCPDPVPAPVFSYTIEDRSEDQTDIECDGSTYELHLYTSESFYNNIYVIAIDNETNKKEDIEFSAEWNTKRKRLDVQLLGADYSKTCTYTIYASNNEDSDTESCVAKTFTLKINGEAEYAIPEIMTQPVGATYYYKTSKSELYSDKACSVPATIAVLTVSATISEGEIAYQWYNTDGAISGETATSYTPTGAGSYYVIVSNAAHAASCVTSNTAKVVLSNVNNPTPKITTDIASASYDKISEAATLVVVASVDASDPDLHYQWYKDGAAISGATSSSYKPIEFGSYYVDIWNVVGTEESEHIASTTSVISENAAVLKCVTPSAATQVAFDATNGNELTVAFTCNIDATITYQWYFAEGESEESNSETAEKITGATSATYTATEVGTYFCMATATSIENGTSNMKSLSSYKYYVTEQELEGTGSIGFDFN